MKKATYVGVFAFLILMLYSAGLAELTQEQKAVIKLLKKIGTEEELKTISLLMETKAPQSEIQGRINLIKQRTISKLDLEEKAFYYSLNEVEQLDYLASSNKRNWIKKWDEKLIKQLCNTQEGKIQYYSLKNLLSKNELTEFIRQDPTVRERWLKTYWASKDPTPTTTENEWKEEFERRVEFALANFHMPWMVPWDDRGNVYIKLGAPEERKIVITDKVEEIEIWTYFLNGKEVFFEFKEKGNKELRLVPHISGDKIRDQDYAINFYVQKSELSSSRAIYHYDYGGKALDFAWEVLKFRRFNNAYEILVNVGIPIEKLERDSAETVHLNLKIAVRNELGNIIDQDSIIAQQRVPRTKDYLLVDRRKFRLSPGDYTVALEIRDELAKKIGLYKDRLFLPAYSIADSFSEPGLTLSRAIISSKVLYAQPGDEQNKFYTNGFLIYPNPGHIFFQEQEPEIKAYFEIYNLTPKDDTIRFATTSFIIRTDIDSALVWSDTTVLTYQNFSNEVTTYQVLPLLNSHELRLGPGDYIWRIDVIDLNSLHKSESIVSKLKIKS